MKSRKSTAGKRLSTALLENADTDIYVAGSNSRLMSSEISTYLSGRYISIPVYTLSFAEYLEFSLSIHFPLQNILNSRRISAEEYFASVSSTVRVSSVSFPSCSLPKKRTDNCEKCHFCARTRMIIFSEILQ